MLGFREVGRRVGWGVVALASAMLALPAAALAQAPGGFSGVWVLDSDRRAAGDVYAEFRIVRQNESELWLTMIDYGTAWISGSFRDVVRIMPWTFRFAAWGPRRGSPASSQPRTRVRWSATNLVLGKLTERGTGDFVWIWSLSDDQMKLTQRDSPRPWTEDLGDDVVQGDGLTFLRASPTHESPTSLGVMAARMRQVLPSVREIAVRVSPDASNLLVSAPRRIAGSWSFSLVFRPESARSAEASRPR